jgi:hypothetical protein
MQPNAAPPRMMAEGGLSNLPLPHMFRQTSYADGGIVYFGDPAKNPDEEQLVPRGMPIPERETSTIGDIFRKIGGESAINAIREGYYKSREKEKLLDESAGAFSGMRPGIFEQMTPTERAQRIANADLLLKGPQKVAPLTQEQLALRAQQFKTATSPDSDASEQADRMTGSKVQPNAVPANPNKQASNTGSAIVNPAKPPAMAEFKSQFDTSKMGKVETPEQIYAQQQGIKALAGVSNDPMKDIKERYAKLEAKRAGQEAQDPYDNLMATLSAFSQAKPTSGFGVQMGVGADAGFKMQKEQDALRDKQATEMNALQAGIAKEDDARKRGDAKGIEDAIAKQKEAQFKLYELANQEKTASATYENAQTNKAKLPFEEMQARAQLNQSLSSLAHSRRPTSEEFAYKMYKEDPAYFNAKNPKENAAVQAALKNYFEGTLSLKLQSQFPNPESYLSSLGLATKAGGGTPPPTITSKDEFNKLPSGTKYISKDGQQYVKP